jgi:hypothetical protein
VTNAIEPEAKVQQINEADPYPPVHNGLVAGSVIGEPPTKPIANQQRLCGGARFRPAQVIQGGCYRSDDEIAENEKCIADPSFSLLWHPILRRAFDDYFASAPLMAGCVDDQVLRPVFDWRLRKATDRSIVLADESR